MKEKIPPSKQFENLIENPRNRGRIDAPNSHIHDCSLSWLDTDIFIKIGIVKLVLQAQVQGVVFLAIS